MDQEWRLPWQGQHPLLHHRALHVIILIEALNISFESFVKFYLNNDVFLENLYSKQLSWVFAFRKHNLEDNNFIINEG